MIYEDFFKILEALIGIIVTFASKLMIEIKSDIARLQEQNLAQSEAIKDIKERLQKLI